MPPLIVCCSTKYAIDGFVDGLRREVLTRGVRVHSVDPDPVRTEWLARSAATGRARRASRAWRWFPAHRRHRHHRSHPGTLAPPTTGATAHTRSSAHPQPRSQFARSSSACAVLSGGPGSGRR